MTITITEDIAIDGANGQRWISNPVASLSAHSILVHPTGTPILLAELDRHIAATRPPSSTASLPYKISSIDVKGSRVIAISSANPAFRFGTHEVALCEALCKTRRIGPYAPMAYDNVGAPSFNLWLANNIGLFQPPVAHSPIEWQPLRAESGTSMIRVPQGHYAIAMGRAQDIGVLYASGANSVAVALVAHLPGKMNPKVLIGHFDGRDTVTPMVETMVRALAVKDPRVYIAAADCPSPLFDQVTNALDGKKISFNVTFADSRLELAVDLKSGEPIEAAQLAVLPEYVANVATLDRYKTALIAQHAPALAGRPQPRPIDLAFDLRQGRPQGYNKKASAIKADRDAVALAALDARMQYKL